MTSTPVAATDASTWNNSVDLPMPGGPKRSVTDPLTTPPPMTRSSSLTPVGNGCAASVETSHSAWAGVRPLGAGRGRERASATASVFHSPQLGQRPTQRKDVVPQASQR